VTEERGHYQECRKILIKELWLYYSHLDYQNKEHETVRAYTTHILEQFRDLVERVLRIDHVGEAFTGIILKRT
jgi:hypothetical protein